MTQYNSLNAKLSNSQLNKLTPAIKSKIEVVSRLSSNMVGDDKTNFPHKLPLMKNVIKPLAKSVLIPLGLTAAASAADAGIHKKIFGSEHNNTTTLIISNDKMKDIIRIVKSLDDSGLWLQGVSETIQNEAKEQKRWFLSMLLDTLGAKLLGNILAGKGINGAEEGVIRAGNGAATKKQGKGIVRAGHGKKTDF